MAAVIIETSVYQGWTIEMVEVAGLADMVRYMQAHASPNQEALRPGPAELAPTAGERPTFVDRVALGAGRCVEFHAPTGKEARAIREQMHALDS